MSAAPYLSIVVPIFNERENLRPLDGEIAAAVAELGRPAEILYVDDASTDGSADVLAELVGAPDGTPRRVVTLRRNFGQTAAMAAGFDLAEGEVIVPLDGDGQNDPADIPRLVEKLEEGFDVVSGWRRQRHDRAVTRRLPSWVANRLVGWVGGLRLHDYGCTLKAYRASLLKEVRLYGDMHRFLPIYLHRIGARVTELEVHHRPRTHGESKYGLGRIYRVLLDLVLLGFLSGYATRPMHFFGQVALAFGALGFLVLGLMVVFKLGWLSLVGIDYQADFVETPLPALAATFVTGVFSSLFFGILGELLMRVQYESQGLSPYRIGQVQDSRAQDSHVRHSGD